MVLAEPAFTVGASDIVSTRVLDTALHGPVGSSVVSVKVTVPLFVEIGVKLTNAGVPVAIILLSCEGAVVIVPVAEVIDQVPVEAPPPIVAPARAYCAPEQIDAAGPAFTTGALLTVSTTVLVADTHGPLGSLLVKVSVTVPLEAMGVNVTEEGVPVAAKELNWLVAPDIPPVKLVIDQVPSVAPPPMLEPTNA